MKDKFIKYIQVNFITIALLFVFAIFHPLFESYLSKILVNPILSKVDSVVFNDAVFLILFTASLINFYLKRINNYKISSKSLLQNLVAISIYSIYRFKSELWDFTSFNVLEEVKYLDVIALYFLGNILLYILYKSKNDKTSENKGFHLDSSLGKDGNDLLNRASLAAYLTKEIEETNSPNSSFAIGISSEWGNGKTSFFDLIERNLELDKNIIVKINPWINHDSKSIVKDFFNALSIKLSEYNSDISPLIKKYAELLVGVGNNNLNKILNPLLKQHSQNATALSEFEQIDNAIKNLDKKLIIFIDDLDRLYKEEIIQVVKLIRNSANFGNTVFIVAYDRNYVTNAIKDINNYNSDFFLEKIFQLEIRLPNFENQIIQKRIYDLLSPRVTQTDKSELLDILLNKKNSFDSSFFNSGTLTTLRDATRFANSFLVAYNYLQGEIVLADLLNLEALRLKFPEVYKLIFFQNDEYLETTTDSYGKSYYSLKKEKGNKDNSLNKVLIEQFLLENHETIGVQKTEIEKAMNLLYCLFPSSDNLFTSKSESLLSVCNPSSFERYSHYRLMDGNLSEIEFSRYRSKSYEEFTQQVNHWVQHGLRWDLKKRFENINSFSDKEDFEKVIKTIFFFSRLPAIDSIENDFSGFDFENLYAKLNRVKQYLAAKYFADEEEYQKFVVKLFEDAPSPFSFDIEFIYSCFRKRILSDEFIVKKDDLQRIRLQYLDSYIKEAKTFDSNIWHLYHYNDLVETSNHVGNSFQINNNKNPEATKLIKAFIKEKGLDDFLKAIISIEPFDRNSFVVSDIIPKMFENFDTFGDFLSEFNEDDYKYLREFKDFYSKLKAVNYNRYIKYDFKDIPLKK